MNIASSATLVLVMVLTQSAFAKTPCIGDTAIITQNPEVDDQSCINVQYDRQYGRLRVTAQQVGFEALLAAVSAASGIRFIGETVDGNEPVDIRFEFLALDDALAHLLRGRSYIVRESADETLAVWLLPTGDSERLMEIDVELEEFYNNLTGSPGAEALAGQIRHLARNPGITLTK